MSARPVWLSTSSSTGVETSQNVACSIGSGPRKDSSSRRRTPEPTARERAARSNTKKPWKRMVELPWPTSVFRLVELCRPFESYQPREVASKVSAEAPAASRAASAVQARDRRGKLVMESPFAARQACGTRGPPPHRVRRSGCPPKPRDDLLPVEIAAHDSSRSYRRLRCVISTTL